MKLSDAIRKRIRFYLKQKNINVWNLCKMSGIPCSTISTFMSCKTELIKLDTLLHICEGFNITLGEFFSEEKFIRDFEFENDIYLDPVKQIEYEEEQEYDFFG